MPIHPTLEAELQDDLLDLLRDADTSGNFQSLEQRLADASAEDPWMQPFHGESGTKYYKPFAQTIAPKMIPAIKDGLAQGKCPEIEYTALEIDTKRAELGLGPFGSPQDVLYAFTSERYANWGPTLDSCGFRSACMRGQAMGVVTLAPRMLDIGEPDLVVEEVAGAISTDFWETLSNTYGEAPLNEVLRDITDMTGQDLFVPELPAVTEASAATLLESLVPLSDDPATQPLASLKARIHIPELQKISSLEDANQRIRQMRKALRAPDRSAKKNLGQEQLAQKYSTEGNFIQKLLGGARVDHIQSNVKMVPNPLRGYKSEVDSIYRVLGQKKILLVEAKGKPIISRTQLYQTYETFRLRLPADWDIAIVAILLSSNIQGQDNVEAIVDVLEISFDPDVLGLFSESLFSVKITKHIRWLIRQ